MFNRALQGHSGKNLDIFTFSSQKDWERLHTISVSKRILKIRKSKKIWRTCARRFWNKRGAEKQCTSHLGPRWIDLQLCRTGLPRFEEPSWPFILWWIWKRRRIRWNVTKRRTSVSYAATQFRPSASPCASTSKVDQKGSQKNNPKREYHHQRRKGDATATRRGKPQGTNQKTKRHWKRDRWEKPSAQLKRKQ